MLICYTYQDYEEAADKGEFIRKSIQAYTSSGFYSDAVLGEKYFRGENPAIMSSVGNTLRLSGGKNLKMTQPVTTNIFQRLVIQQNATLLSNGAQITADDKTDVKPMMGIGFDRALARLGENALKHGVGYGFWDYDRIAVFTAKEFFTLDDERSGAPVAGVRFWDRQRESGKTATFVEFYESDGVTEYTIKDGVMSAPGEKKAYGLSVRPVTNDIEGVKSYHRLPVAQFWGNDDHTTELSFAIKSKIDFLDRVWTNFSDSATRINLIYWIISQYSVTTEEAIQMIEQIYSLGVVANKDDFKAEPHSFELPSESVDKAIEMLEKAITADYMGVSLREVTGGSLTNVAINTAFNNLMNKVARYEWQPFRFIQDMMDIIGLPPTENIQFKREVPRNMMEETNMIMGAASYLDEQTVIEKLPFVTVDEIAVIIERKALERLGYSGEGNEPPSGGEVIEGGNT